MTVAESVGEKVSVAEDHIPPLALAPETPPSPHEEMLASIGRTGLLKDPIFLPRINSTALQEGNRAVEAEHGKDARRLLIVGPDVIAVSGLDGFIRLPNQRQAELLGYAILLRRVTRAGEYLSAGMFAHTVSDASRPSTVSKAMNGLNALFDELGVDHLLATTGRQRGDRQFGMDDVMVRDMRHSNAYELQRQLHSQQLFEEFILIGGERPRMTERPMVKGARSALRELVRMTDDEDPKKSVKLDDEQVERFRLVSQQQATMIGSRTDEHEAAHALDSGYREAAYLREEIREEIEPRWQMKAACRGPQAHLFFPPRYYERKYDKLEREKRAKAICATCPVVEPCLLQALESKERHGIYGGKTEKERRAILGLPEPKRR